MRLAYDEERGVSVVHCMPHTGRTHQVRCAGRVLAPQDRYEGFIKTGMRDSSFRSKSRFQKTKLGGSEPESVSN